MGLDIFDLVLGIEEAIGVPLPDEIIAGMTTPRQMIEYLHGELPQSPSNSCLSQRSFYMLRRILGEKLGVGRELLRPATEIVPLFPEATAHSAWKDLGKELDVCKWPKIRSRQNWFAQLFQASRPRTLGEAAKFLAGSAPRSLKPAGEGWSWREVRSVVEWQFDYHLGIRGYALDDRFVEDIGLD